jgi:hypothetical protein
MRTKTSPVERGIFLVVLCPVVVFALLALGQHWLPLHDTMQNLEWGHYLFSNLAQGEFPAWAPQMNWGKNTNLGFLAFLHPAFIFLSPLMLLPVKWNIASLFYFSLFLTELILVTGVVLLARRLFERKATAVFVAFCTVGSIHWASQVNFNFLYYYALPFIFFLIHSGAEEKRATKILWAAVLLALTGTIGNGLYLVIFQGLVFLVFLGASLWQYRASVPEMVRRGRTTDIILLLAFFSVIAISAAFLIHSGMPACASPDRSETGKITYHTFLSYEADASVSNFSGFLFGLEPPLDVTSFAGVFIGLFSILGLAFAPRRKQVPLIATLAFCFLFYLGASSFVAPLAYYFPLVSMYRHIGSVVPIIKLTLILMAGFGFDRLVERVQEKSFSGDRHFVPALLGLLGITLSILVISYFVREPAGFAFAGRRLLVVLVLVAAMILGSLVLTGERAVRGAIVPLFLLVTAIDVFSYRSLMMHQILMPVKDAVWSLFDVRKFSGSSTRMLSQFDDPKFTMLSTIQFPNAFRDNPGSYQVLTEKLAGCENDRKDCRRFDLNRFNVIYDVNEQFVNVDACLHLGLSHHMLPEVFDFYSFYNLSVPLAWRIQNPAYQMASTRLTKAAGCGESKLRRFENLRIVDTEQEVAAYLASPGDAPPTLLTSKGNLEDYLSQPGAPSREILNPHVARQIASADEPVSGDVKLETYTPTTVTMAVDGGNSTNGYWLYFADGWHENWRAVVNGIQTPILRANHAFKAIYLPPGHSSVKFIYDSREDWYLGTLLWLESCCLILGLTGLVVRQLKAT